MMWPVSNILNNFDNKVKNEGFKLAVAGLIKKTGTKLEVISNKEINDGLKKDPVLIVANHPAESDVPVLLAAIEQRKDVFLIINSIFVGWMKNLDKHLIEVYVRHHAQGGKNDWREKMFCKLTGNKIMSLARAKNKNRLSIIRAGEVLKKGGVVIIYPGPDGEDKKWYSGVGYLIEKAKERKGVKVLMANIEGTSKWDYLRLIPNVSRLMPNFRVTFSNLIDVKDVWQGGAKETATRLESRFRAWQDGLDRMKIEKVYWKIPGWSLAMVRSMVFWLGIRL